MAENLIYEVGDPIAWFTAKTITGDGIDIHVEGGRYVVLSFMGEPAPATADFDPKLGELLCLRPLLNEDRLVCYGILTQPPPQRSLHWLIKNIPLQFLADYNSALTNSFGADHTTGTILLDPMLRLIAHIPANHPEGHGFALNRLLNALPPPHEYHGYQIKPPILVVPHVLEPEFCHTMIAYYQSKGGSDSGFMLDRNGQTSTVTDYRLKRRSDCLIEDQEMVDGLRQRFVKRLMPAVERAFTFKITRMDRFLITRYGSETGDHFFRHRDNLNAGARHRRFAITLNLNGDPGHYEGGELRLPEYSRDSYKTPTGAALMFSCGLLHEVTPVTKGERFAFVAFFYGEEDARIRAANNVNLADGEALYNDGHDRLFPEERSTDTADATTIQVPNPTAETSEMMESETNLPDIKSLVPIQVVADPHNNPQVACLDLGKTLFTAPFFSQTIAHFMQTHPQVTPHQITVERLFRDIDDQTGLSPRGLVFHLSRCGSTLVTQMLAGIHSHLVISEPDPVNDVLGPQWGHLPDAQKQHMVAGLLRILGQPRTLEQTHYFIKFSSWNTAFFHLLADVIPQCPKVFIYRDPVEVMVSLMKEPPGWLAMMNDPLIGGWFVGCPPWMLGWMSPEEYTARLLARIFNGVWETRDSQWLLINYSELPHAMTSRILPHFGLDLDQSEQERLIAISQIHAKDPNGTRRFVPDSEDKRKSASPEILRVVDQFLREPYEKLEAFRRIKLEFATTPKACAS